MIRMMTGVGVDAIINSKGKLKKKQVRIKKNNMKNNNK